MKKKVLAMLTALCMSAALAPNAAMVSAEELPDAITLTVIGVDDVDAPEHFLMQDSSRSSAVEFTAEEIAKHLAEGEKMPVFGDQLEVVNRPVNSAWEYFFISDEGTRFDGDIELKNIGAYDFAANAVEMQVVRETPFYYYLRSLEPDMNSVYPDYEVTIHKSDISDTVAMRQSNYVQPSADWSVLEKGNVISAAVVKGNFYDNEKTFLFPLYFVEKREVQWKESEFTLQPREIVVAEGDFWGLTSIGRFHTFAQPPIEGMGYMVTGVIYDGVDSQEPACYLISNLENYPECILVGAGELKEQLAEGSEMPKFGDILCVDAMINETAPAQFAYQAQKNCIVNFGSGISIFGENFRKVMNRRMLHGFDFEFFNADYVIHEEDYEVVTGDINDDDSIDILDVVTVNKHLLGASTLRAYGKMAADTDGNNTLDTTDSLNILKYTVELIDHFDK
ncbi:MAG: hypothetical protein II916_06650 [Oscillospiraceae bacterium]|nr:hypothetical protein [Oscillospiraceae bacterium]